ncbi:MAG TPA: ABC transporter transmembrane domain-containing protein [Pseudonocardiaceae bacterium]
MDRYCVGPTMAVDWDDDGTVRPTRRLALRALSYFGPHRARGVVVVGCIAVQAVLGLAPALVFKSLIDYLAHPTHGYLPVLLLVSAGIAAAVVGGLVGVAQSYLSNVISQHIVSQMRRELFENLIDQPVGFFTSTRAGDILSRLNNDVGGVESVVTDTVFGLIANLLTGVATLVLMFGFSWPLTVFVLAMIPLVALPTGRAGRLTYAARVRTQSKIGELSAYLQETLGISGILLLKAFGKQPAARAEFGRLNDELRQLEIRQAWSPAGSGCSCRRCKPPARH